LQKIIGKQAIQIEILKKTGTRKEDGIPLVGIKVLREREKRLLLDFIRDNLKQPKKRRKE
jgi:hypothetical protein